MEENPSEATEHPNAGSEVDGKHNSDADESEIQDSDYSFQSEEDTEDAHPRAATEEVIAEVDNEEEGVQSEYASSNELLSCSSTDEEGIGPSKPRYSEFREELDMKDPQLKIGMKFRSFDQFKQAVKNYGIKNRCELKFRPNDKTRCKAFCKKNCPFYVWASPMYTNKETVQIKSGNLKHECGRDHNIRHCTAEWIAKEYLDQFRADPSWKLAGIIQAVRTNQEVDINRMKAWRAKNIASRYSLPCLI